MNTLARLCSTACLSLAAPLTAQTTPAPVPATPATNNPAATQPPAFDPMTSAPAAAAASDPATDLTEAEQATLRKCEKMDPVQQAQSSKCSKVMIKAGKADPAKARAPAASM